MVEGLTSLEETPQVIGVDPGCRAVKGRRLSQQAIPFLGLHLALPRPFKDGIVAAAGRDGGGDRLGDLGVVLFFDLAANPVRLDVAIRLPPRPAPVAGGAENAQLLREVERFTQRHAHNPGLSLAITLWPHNCKVCQYFAGSGPRTAHLRIAANMYALVFGGGGDACARFSSQRVPRWGKPASAPGRPPDPGAPQEGARFNRAGLQCLRSI